jgi:hypothetical protein
MSILLHACLPLRINAALFESVPLICSCDFSLRLGLILASCIQVRTDRILVDALRNGGVRSETA